MKIKVGDKFTIPATVATVVSVDNDGVYSVTAEIDGYVRKEDYTPDGRWVNNKTHPLDLREENRITLIQRTPQVGDVWEDERGDVHEVVLLRETPDGQTGVLALLLPRLYPHMFPVAHFTEHFTFVRSTKLADEESSAPSEVAEPKQRIRVYTHKNGLLYFALEGTNHDCDLQAAKCEFLRYLEE